MKKTDDMTVMTEWHERLKLIGLGGHHGTTSIAE